MYLPAGGLFFINFGMIRAYKALPKAFFLLNVESWKKSF